jgi:hypothetical protein
LDSVILKTWVKTPKSSLRVTRRLRYAKHAHLFGGYFVYKMAAITKLGNCINAALNGLLDPENRSLDIKIMSICASHAEI